MVRKKGLVGQLPMGFMLPETDWAPPTELPDMTGEGHLAIDLETMDEGLRDKVGPAWFRRGGFVTGVTITSSQRTVYAPVRHPETECLDHDAVGRWLRHHMLRPRTSTARKFYHNAPYDLGWAWAEWDIPVPDDIDDTMAMAFVLDENKYAYGLDAVCRDLDIDGKDETQLKAALSAYGFEGKDGKANMWRLPGRFVGPYAEQDGVATLDAGLKMIGMLETDQLTEAYQLEADIIPLCVEMRRRGVRVNTSRAEQTMETFHAKAKEQLGLLEDHIQIGRRITIDDIRSPRFMSDVFSRLGIPVPKTDKDNDSFSNEWMSKFDGHPVPKLCARALQYTDAAEKFLGNYILGFANNGRIHAEIHSYRDKEEADGPGGGTVTTRFSYSSPPLQQMPSRDEEIARDIRACFDPEEGEVWAAVDYSQQEYRLMVHYASACNIVGADTAVAMYHDDPDTDFHNMVVELTGLPRRRAKDCNFAKAFGAGIPKFALMTGMSEEEAKEKMAIYDDKVPFIKLLADHCSKVAGERGYIRMIDGARGRFPDWEPRWLDWNKKVRPKLDELRAQGRPAPKMNPCSLKEAQARKNDKDHPWFGERLKRAKTHKAMNKLIQGSAARQMKMAMRACWREGIVPLLQMHDELDLSVRDRETADRVGELMRDVIKLRVPVKCDVEFGSNWGRAAKDERTGHTPTWEAAIADTGR